MNTKGDLSVAPRAAARRAPLGGTSHSPYYEHPLVLPQFKLLDVRPYYFVRRLAAGFKNPTLSKAMPRRAQALCLIFTGTG